MTMTKENKYRLSFAIRAKKDLKRLRKSEYWEKARKIFQILASDPFKEPPEYEVLRDNWRGYCSRRVNVQHRIVYKVIGDIVEVVSCWTHYHD
jgi:Txe/YoeB family toxin of toxin-antitoxin system